ncbi:FG-GAP repeat protein [Deltaproteobacteria bacterium]|nr:FG-GAP repeat protein [Deltaproteobacteria bacterium]
MKAANNDASDTFGWSVALSGDTLAVGAPAESSNQTTITNGTTASSNNNSSKSGAVYVYVLQ